MRLLWLGIGIAAGGYVGYTLGKRVGPNRTIGQAAREWADELQVQAQSHLPAGAVANDYFSNSFLPNYVGKTYAPAG